MALLRGGCVVCGAAGGPLCPACRRQLEPPPTTRIRGVGRVPALFAYAGHGARAVQCLKYRGGRRLVGPFADDLAELVRATHDLSPDAAVTWIPTSGLRRRDRGFDQAELLARAVARRLGIPARGVLRRARGRQLTGLGRDRREVEAATAFSVRGVPPAALLVVDDVSTTGASLRAAVRTLREAGTQTVHGAVVARTP